MSALAFLYVVVPFFIAILAKATETKLPSWLRSLLGFSIIIGFAMGILLIAIALWNGFP